MIARGRLHRLADERGQSLVLALLVLTVLAIALGSVIFFTSSNQRNSAYEKAAQVSRSLAEAGVNNGISVLTNAAQTNSPNLISSTLLSTQTTPYPGGSVQWWGTFDGSEQSTSCPPPTIGNTVYACVGTWTLHGTSTVTNPNSSGAAIHRTVTAKMQVYRQQTSNPADVWNWVFSPYSSGTSACDTTFGQSLTVNVRVWVGGNLCAPNNSVFKKSLYVGGYLNLGSPASVGTQSTPIASPEEVYVGGGCQYSNKSYNPCVKNGTIVSGKAASTNVFANTLYTQSGTPIPPYNPLPATDQIFPNVAPPPLCWGLNDCPPDSTNPIAGGWYSVASPGPKHNCDTSSTTPAGNPLPQFDNDGVFNNSVPGVFNLTPDAYSYTCKTAGGELSWSNTTHTLTVQGVIFIDGSVTATTSGNTPVTYKGWGGSPAGTCNTPGSCQSVLFLSGTFLLVGEKLCAVVSGTTCDQTTGAWDPNQKLLIVATHNKGGQLSANDGVEVNTNGTYFQGGLYAKYAIAIQSGGTVQGPLVSGTQTISDGQSGVLSFPLLTISPFAINSPPAFMLCLPSQPCQPFAYKG